MVSLPKLHPHSWRAIVRSWLENVGNGGSSMEGVVDRSCQLLRFDNEEVVMSSTERGSGERRK